MNLDICSITDKFIQKYQEDISKRYKNVNIETLKDIWLNVSIDNTSEPIKVEKKKKKSSYQNFFAITRAEITSQNPELKFGEISKLISQKWKSMTKEEKNSYEVKNDDEGKKNFNNFIDFIDEEDDENEDRTTFEENEIIDDEDVCDEDDEFDFEEDE